MMQAMELENKPMRVIREQLTDIPKTCAHVKITQGDKEAARGAIGEFRVFLEKEDGSLDELRDYNYFKGEIELTSTQTFD